ncbi:MAG TPA: TIM barrel protein [Gaiellaceae bacterium]|nr:TIM barrel protein [Gaiellaceae bacterium]
MKLACADDTFRLLRPHRAVLELVAALGVEAVDVFLAGNRSIIRPEDVRGDVPAAAAAIRADLAGVGLAVSDLFVLPWTDLETMAPNHPDAAERERSQGLFRDMLELAVGLEAPGLTILPGIEWPDDPGSFERAVDELGWRADEARREGLRFSVEPHVGSVVATPALARSLAEAAPGVELTLDYSHFVRQGLAEEEADVLIPFTRHVHVRGASPQRVQESIRRSTLDFERIVAALRAGGYDRYLTLEYVWLEWEHCHECDNLAESILLRDRLRAALAGEAWSYPEVG